MQYRTARLILILTLPLLGISWVSPTNTPVKTKETSVQFIATLKNIWVTSPFGKRKAPFKGQNADHTGIDLAGKTGTSVKATADGIVSLAKPDKSWGNIIRINHASGYSSVYAHLDKILVKPNQTVEQGDIIGKVGSSGKSTGPHLHFELRHDNKPVNPADYIDF